MIRVAGVVVGISGALLITSIARGQAKLEFEVATVKPAAPLTGRGMAPRGGPESADPSRVNYTFMTMKNLLMNAYDVNFTQVTGPAWIDSEHYDVVATVPAGATKEQVKVMLQNLLAERFKLVVHRETKEIAMYELVVGKGGSKLKPYVEDPNEPKREPGKPLMDKNGVPIVPPGGIMMTMGTGRREVTARKQTIERLATSLALDLNRPVIDKTGLTGDYDYKLAYAWEGPGIAADPDAPSLETAVQEQLGLKLEPKKGPVEMLVVDSGEKTPAAN